MLTEVPEDELITKKTAICGKLVRDNLDRLEYSKKIGNVTYIKFKKKEQINFKKVVDEIKK